MRLLQFVRWPRRHDHPDPGAGLGGDAYERSAEREDEKRKCIFYADRQMLTRRLQTDARVQSVTEG